MPTAIEITDVGPIERLKIPVPDSGGVVVLTGRNGGGKSTALEAVRSLVTRKNHGLSTRDDAPLGASGKIEWGEARLTVGKRTATTGELTVDHLEGKLDLAALVDPGMATAETNDARRIKALASLSGIEATRELFYELTGGEDVFNALVSAKAITQTDLVDMAAIVKKDIEAAARKQEDLEVKHRAAADICKANAEGIDLTAQSDAHELQQRLEAAIKAEAEVKARADSQAEHAERVKQARENLAQAEKSYEGRTIEQAEALSNDKQRLYVQANESVEDLKQQLEQAISHATECGRAAAEAQRDLGYVREHFALIDKWKATIGSGEIAQVSDEELTAAVQATLDARRAIETGVRVRDAKLQAAAGKSHEAEAAAAAKQAEFLRAAAKAVDGVLASAIKCEQFVIRDGRLLVKKPDRRAGECFYEDLSDGERWKLAIDLAVERLKRDGVKPGEAVLVIPQGPWSELSPSVQRVVHDHAVACGVTILAAQADDEPLRAEPFATSQPNGERHES